MSEEDEIGLEVAKIFEAINKLPQLAQKIEKRTEKILETAGGSTGILRYLETMHRRFEIFLKDINNIKELDELLFRHAGTYFSPKEGDIKPIKIVQIKNMLSIPIQEGYPSGMAPMIYNMWRAALSERRQILENKDSDLKKEPQKVTREEWKEAYVLALIERLKELKESKDE